MVEHSWAYSGKKIEFCIYVVKIFYFKIKFYLCDICPRIGSRTSDRTEGRWSKYREGNDKLGIKGPNGHWDSTKTINN